jgi:hypothetical protein
VIAKTILDLFTLLPGSSRATAQSSDQPLQAFSDSLLAAAKSYSQSGGTISTSSKTVHGQSSISGGADTSVAVIDDADNQPQTTPQPSQATNTDSTSLQAALVSPSTSEAASIDTTAQSGQIQLPTNLATSQSSSAQTGEAQSNLFTARLFRASGFQSRFTGTKTLRTRQTTSRIASTGVASRTFRNVTITRLAGSQSTDAQSGSTQQASAQPVVASVQTLLSDPAMAQITVPSTVIPIAENVSSSVSTLSQSMVTPANVPQTSTSQQADVQSNIASVESPLVVSAGTQRSSIGMAAPFTRFVSAMRLAGTQTAFVQANLAPATISNTGESRPAATQAGATTVRLPLGTASTTEIASTVLASQTTTNLASAISTANDSNFIPAIIDQTSGLQPAAIQSSSAPAQIPGAAPIANQSDSNAAASQSTSTLPAVASGNSGSIFTLASILSTSIPWTASVQSNVDAAQTPVAPPVIATQPTSHETEVGTTEIQSILPPTSALQPAVIQSNVATAQIPAIMPAAIESFSTGAATQPTPNVTPATWNETGSTSTLASVLSTTIPQSTGVQSYVAQAQMPVAAAEADQNPAPVVSYQPTLNVPAATQSSSTPVQTPLAATATTQSTWTVAASLPTHNAPAATLAKTQSIIAKTSIPQTTVSPSDADPAQTPLTIPATTLDTTAVATSQQPAQTIPASGRRESEQSIVPSNNVQPQISQTSAPQQASLQSDNASAQRPATEPVENPIAATFETAQSATVQSTITPAQAPIETLQPAQNAKSAKPVEAHSSVSTTNASVNTLTETVVTPTSVIPLAKDANLGSSSQTAAQIPPPHLPDWTAPVSASAESREAETNAVAATAPHSAPAASNSVAQDSPSPAAVNSNSIGIQSAVDNLAPAIVPVQVLPETVIGSEKDIAASASNAGQAAQAESQPAAANQTSIANTTTAPSGIADPQAALPLAASIAATHASVASLKPVSTAKPHANASATAKNASAEPASTKKIAEPGSEAGSKTGSQDASGNQSQSGSNPQAQIAAPVPVPFAVHPGSVIATAENPAPVAANHAASTTATSAGFAASATDNSISHASATLPQTAPVINTARLIQNMGQTEMRVGMRSNEFGNISISTSATRGQVSAQISVEHGELAKTLTAHLPEMQARLGGSQPMDVRIDMNGAATGQGTSNFGGMQNDTAGQSRGGRQQEGNMAAGQSDNSVVEQKFSPVVAAAPSGYARLDIRV